MKNKTLVITIILIGVIGIATVLYNNLKDNIQLADVVPIETNKQEKSDEVSKEKQYIKAPDFTIKDKDDNEFKLSDFFGKPIVLNFWASWCSPCKSEMPEFEKVYNELGDNINFIMIDAVDGFKETRKKGMEYIEKEEFSFPVYFDMYQEAVIGYGVRAYPTSIFIDKDGYIVTGVEGAIDERVLRKGIELITEN